MKHAVFFDVDDTLYDHLIPFKIAIQKWVKEPSSFPFERAYHRMRYYSDMLSLEFGGAGKMDKGASTAIMQRKRFQLALREFNIEVTEEQANDIQQAYLNCQFDIECFDGAKQLIKDLQARDIVVGILTNGAKDHQWKKIRALALDQIVPLDRIFVSGEFGIDKPDPQIFHMITSRLQLQEYNCTYIGDSWRNDVIGATSANWNVIWFNHRLQQGEGNITLKAEVKDYFELSRLLIRE